MIKKQKQANNNNNKTKTNIQTKNKAKQNKTKNKQTNKKPTGPFSCPQTRNHLIKIDLSIILWPSGVLVGQNDLCL